MLSLNVKYFQILKEKTDEHQVQKIKRERCLKQENMWSSWKETVEGYSIYLKTYVASIILTAFQRKAAQSFYSL